MKKRQEREGERNKKWRNMRRERERERETVCSVYLSVILQHSHLVASIREKRK